MTNTTNSTHLPSLLKDMPNDTAVSKVVFSGLNDLCEVKSTFDSFSNAAVLATITSLGIVLTLNNIARLAVYSFMLLFDVTLANRVKSCFHELILSVRIICEFPLLYLQGSINHNTIKCLVSQPSDKSNQKNSSKTEKRKKQFKFVEQDVNQQSRGFITLNTLPIQYGSGTDAPSLLCKDIELSIGEAQAIDDITMAYNKLLGSRIPSCMTLIKQLFTDFTLDESGNMLNLGIAVPDQKVYKSEELWKKFFHILDLSSSGLHINQVVFSGDIDSFKAFSSALCSHNNSKLSQNSARESELIKSLKTLTIKDLHLNLEPSFEELCNNEFQIAEQDINESNSSALQAARDQVLDNIQRSQSKKITRAFQEAAILNHQFVVQENGRRITKKYRTLAIERLICPGLKENISLSKSGNVTSDDRSSAGSGSEYSRDTSREIKVSRLLKQKLKRGDVVTTYVTSDGSKDLSVRANIDIANKSIAQLSEEHALLKTKGSPKDMFNLASAFEYLTFQFNGDLAMLYDFLLQFPQELMMQEDDMIEFYRVKRATITRDKTLLLTTYLDTQKQLFSALTMLSVKECQKMSSHRNYQELPNVVKFSNKTDNFEYQSEQTKCVSQYATRFKKMSLLNDKWYVNASNYNSPADILLCIKCIPNAQTIKFSSDKRDFINQDVIQQVIDSCECLHTIEFEGINDVLSDDQRSILTERRVLFNSLNVNSRASNEALRDVILPNRRSY